MGIATTTASNAPRQLSDGNSQGTVLGQSATDKIGFYGITAPVVQPSGATSNLADTASTLTIGAYTASTAGVGFSTASAMGAFMSTVIFLQADMANARKSLNAIHQALSSSGFTKGS